jgi:asparagine synthase (glutamine-hydrolysing)
MCGIAGWLGGLQNGPSYAQRLAHRLHHRGPDAHGTKAWPEAMLVHTRLSIIDLSAAGEQPMSNETGTVWVVFNGEIYNHRELRRWLNTRGHVLRGHSDTEVLSHLYEEEGAAGIAKLRGMFALAIYDTETQTLVLARDRFGIKPLFYAPSDQRLAFASEIRALLELPGIDTQPDRQAIYDYAALFFVPAPATFYRGIRALAPGEVLVAHLQQGRVTRQVSSYHQWTIAPDPTLTLEGAVERVEELIATAVRRQLESDVPLGALLSGGIDSSLVSVAAQAALGGGLQTFNVRFPEAIYDETWAAQAVASHIQSSHITLDMSGVSGTWDEVTTMLMHAGQPFADSSLFPLSAICRLMRHHVTVALSGDGGDEGFGGYDRYWQIARIAQLQTIPAPLWHLASAAIGLFAPYNLMASLLSQRLGELAGADDIDIVYRLFTWIREEEQQRLCRDTNMLPVRRLFESQWQYHLPAHSPRIEHLAACTTEANTRLILPNGFLFKVDTGSMRASLEVRVPLLDEDLFTFALTLPYNLKVSGRSGKRVLRTLASRQLPLAVATKPKSGFVIPVDTWVNAQCKATLHDTLLGPASTLPEYFRPEAYRPWVEAFCNDQPLPTLSRQALYQRVIMLLSLHLHCSHATSLSTPAIRDGEQSLTARF